MKSKVLTILLLFALSYSYAQDELSLQIADLEGVTPEAGDISIALLLGTSQYLSSPQLPSSPGNNSNWTVYPGSAYIPQVSTINPLSNMIGAEIRYFITSGIVVKFTGGAIHRSNPSRVNMPTANDANAPNATWIPAYGSIFGRQEFMSNASLGFEIQNKTRYARLFPYYGISIPFYYNRKSEYDPSLYNHTVYNGSGYVEELYAQDIGWRHGEQVGFGAQLVGGIDYYLLEGFFIGFEIKPASYIYTFQTVAPGSGLPVIQTEAVHLSFLTQPLFKLGFRF